MLTGAEKPRAAAAQPPVINQISPAAGEIGTTVTVSGSQFDVASVTLGSVGVGTFTSDETTVTFDVPQNATLGSANLVIRNSDGQSASGVFEVTSAALGLPPVIYGISPATSVPAGGVQVTVTGDRFDATGGRVLVGGLGLGYTAHAALADPRVAHVTVVDRLPAVIGWLRDGLLPLSDPAHQAWLIAQIKRLRRLHVALNLPMNDAIAIVAKEANLERAGVDNFCELGGNQLDQRPHVQFGSDDGSTGGA